MKTCSALPKKSGAVKITRSKRSVVRGWWSAGHTCKNGKLRSPKLMNSFGSVPAWQDSPAQHLLWLGVSTLRNRRAETWLFVEEPKGQLQRLSEADNFGKLLKMFVMREVVTFGQIERDALSIFIYYSTSVTEQRPIKCFTPTGWFPLMMKPKWKCGTKRINSTSATETTEIKLSAHVFGPLSKLTTQLSLFVSRF